MSAYPLTPAGAAPAAASVSASTDPAKVQMRSLPSAPAPHPGTPIRGNRKGLAEVIELYPAGRAVPEPRKNRHTIRALKHGYFRRARLSASDAGMATAEYAIATLAAVGFAGVLVFLLRSDEVRGFLLQLIRTALALP